MSVNAMIAGTNGGDMEASDYNPPTLNDQTEGGMILCFGTTPAIARTMRFGSLRTGEVNRTADVYTYAAGKAVNAARAIRTLGGDVDCVGVQGGMLGADLMALLDRDAIQHQFLEVAAPTRLCITAIDDSAATATELIEESWPLTADNEESLLVHLEQALGDMKVAVFSGSVARGLKPDFYARCVRLAHDGGAKVVLDASGDALREAIVQNPDVLKINAHELAGLASVERFGSETDLLIYARSIAAMTGGRVIVTHGGASTIGVDSNGAALRVEPLRVQRPVSPIGSGDSFTAGVATAMSRGESIEQCLSLGTACAVANVETPHAAHFDIASVERWRARVRISVAQD